MLLRNLNVNSGLINGTRLTVLNLFENSIQCQILTGAEAGRIVLLPRLDLTPSDNFLPFKLKRRQFPIELAFAMTINKSQGQTLDKIGIYLNKPVFTHGQLYVALSRVRSASNIRIYITQNGRTKNCSTNNIVFSEVLD